MTAGLVVGVALLNKDLILCFTAALALSTILVRPRITLPWRHLFLGLLLATLTCLPDLIWQAAHGWPEITVTSHISTNANRIEFLPMQFGDSAAVFAVLWLAGLIWLLRSREGARFRVFGWAHLLVLLAFFCTGGSYYYAAGMYAVLFAAGGIAIQRWLAGAGQRLRATAFAAAAVGLAISVVWDLPVIPVVGSPTAQRLVWAPPTAINGYVQESLSWPVMAAAVSRAVRLLPAGERDRVVILASNYGEASAIDKFGPRFGLPDAYSGNNEYGYWGPPRTYGPVVAVGRFRHFPLDRGWRRVTQIGIVHGEQYPARIWICTGQRAPWSQLWPHIRY